MYWSKLLLKIAVSVPAPPFKISFPALPVSSLSAELPARVSPLAPPIAFSMIELNAIAKFASPYTNHPENMGGITTSAN